jgi:hypothetical protein
MNKGITTMIYTVTDMDQAKDMFQTFMGIEPYVESGY